MDKRFEAFSTADLSTLYQALDSNKGEARSQVMREQIQEVLDHRNAVNDKIFSVAEEKLTEEGATTQGAGFRAYWAGADDREAAACDLEES